MARIIGAALALAGLVLAAVDLAGTGGRLRALGEWWFRIDRDSLQLLQPAIERHLAPWLFDPVVLTVLEAPAALLLLLVGGALLWLGRRRGQSEF